MTQGFTTGCCGTRVDAPAECPEREGTAVSRLPIDAGAQNGVRSAEGTGFPNRFGC